MKRKSSTMVLEGITVGRWSGGKPMTDNQAVTHDSAIDWRAMLPMTKVETIPPPKRVLVCGGRYFSDIALLNDYLDRVHHKPGISVLIHGAARGADLLAADWAARNGVPAEAYPANWDLHPRAAGPIRNQEMLDKAAPDVVIAFPGGSGTADMTRRARASGLRVVAISADGRAEALMPTGTRKA